MLLLSSLGAVALANEQPCKLFSSRPNASTRKDFTKLTAAYHAALASLQRDLARHNPEKSPHRAPPLSDDETVLKTEIDSITTRLKALHELADTQLERYAEFCEYPAKSKSIKDSLKKAETAATQYKYQLQNHLSALSLAGFAGSVKKSLTAAAQIVDESLEEIRSGRVQECGATGESELPTNFSHFDSYATQIAKELNSQKLNVFSTARSIAIDGKPTAIEMVPEVMAVLKALGNQTLANQLQSDVNRVSFLADYFCNQRSDKLLDDEVLQWKDEDRDYSDEQWQDKLKNRREQLNLECINKRLSDSQIEKNDNGFEQFNKIMDSALRPAIEIHNIRQNLENLFSHKIATEFIIQDRSYWAPFSEKNLEIFDKARLTLMSLSAEYDRLMKEIHFQNDSCQRDRSLDGVACLMKIQNLTRQLHALSDQYGPIVAQANDLEGLSDTFHEAFGNAAIKLATTVATMGLSELAMARFAASARGIEMAEAAKDSVQGAKALSAAHTAISTGAAATVGLATETTRQAVEKYAHQTPFDFKAIAAETAISASTMYLGTKATIAVSSRAQEAAKLLIDSGKLSAKAAAFAAQVNRGLAAVPIGVAQNVAGIYSRELAAKNGTKEKAALAAESYLNLFTNPDFSDPKTLEAWLNAFTDAATAYSMIPGNDKIYQIRGTTGDRQAQAAARALSARAAVDLGADIATRRASGTVNREELMASEKLWQQHLVESLEPKLRKVAVLEEFNGKAAVVLNDEVILPGEPAIKLVPGTRILLARPNSPAGSVASGSTEAHPDVLKLRAEVRTTDSKLLASVTESIDKRLRNRETLYRSLVEAFKQGASDQTPAIARLIDKIATNEKELSALVTSYKEANQKNEGELATRADALGAEATKKEDRLRAELERLKATSPNKKDDIAQKTKDLADLKARHLELITRPLEDLKFEALNNHWVEYSKLRHLDHPQLGLVELNQSLAALKQKGPSAESAAAEVLWQILTVRLFKDYMGITATPGKWHDGQLAVFSEDGVSLPGQRPIDLIRGTRVAVDAQFREKIRDPEKTKQELKSSMAVYDDAVAKIKRKQPKGADLKLSPAEETLLNVLEANLLKNIAQHLSANQIEFTTTMKEGHRVIEISTKKDGAKLNKLALGIEKNIQGAKIFIDPHLQMDPETGAEYRYDEHAIFLKARTILDPNSVDSVTLHEIVHSTDKLRKTKGTQNTTDHSVTAVTGKLFNNTPLYEKWMTYDELRAYSKQTRTALQRLKTALSKPLKSEKLTPQARKSLSDFTPEVAQLLGELIHILPIHVANTNTAIETNLGALEAIKNQRASLSISQAGDTATISFHSQIGATLELTVNLQKGSLLNAVTPDQVKTVLVAALNKSLAAISIKSEIASKNNAFATGLLTKIRAGSTNAELIPAIEAHQIEMGELERQIPKD